MTKLRMVAGIVVLAVVAAYAMHLNPDAFKVSTGEDDNYVLSVTWRPVNMTHKTNIMVKVDGATMINTSKRVSPWGETMTAVKGVRVELTASLYLLVLQEMDCMIMRNGKSVPSTGYMKITSPGVVTCTA